MVGTKLEKGIGDEVFHPPGTSAAAFPENA